jgi:hypothetical protein
LVAANCNAKKVTIEIIIMSEPAQNTPPVTTPAAATDPKASCCGNAQKQSQPQPVNAPAQAKGFKRQNRKQH